MSHTINNDTCRLRHSTDIPLLGHADCRVYTSMWVQNVHEGDSMVNFTLVPLVQICFQECFPAVSDSSDEV